MPSAGILFTGRVLPPPASEHIHPDMVHACEEFTGSEADTLTSQLEGLPMCLVRCQPHEALVGVD